MQNERRASCSLNRNWFMPLIILAALLWTISTSIISFLRERGQDFLQYPRCWMQHRFVWVCNDAFCFGLCSFISSSEFLTRDLLFWLLPRTELKFSSLSIKTKSGNDSSQSPSIYIWRKDWISHVHYFAFTYIEYYPVAKSPESLGQFSTLSLHPCCFE